MPTPFDPFSVEVAASFQRMAATELFHTTVEKDALWETYLGSFEPGTNPIFQVRTEHDCSACRQFIKTLGGVVTIVQNKVMTLWDFEPSEARYQPVVLALAALVRRHVVDNTFLHPERVVGVQTTRSLVNGEPVAWKHLSVNLPSNVVVKGGDIGTIQGDNRASVDVMLRGLQEITPEAIDTVLDLIAQNSLYRGEEHRGAVQAFQVLQRKFRGEEPTLFCWSHLKITGHALARLRNTAIGTLLVDLSNGEDIEDAVKAFESKVAPTNYKRPTALVSKAMIAKAQARIQELGFMSALDRRYARIEDITINNVLFADRSVKKAMNVFEDLSARTPTDLKKLGKVEDVPIDTFMASVLPKATSIEVFFDNKHAGNLVSLIAPSDPTALGMFKWDNNFSWSYAGELADSIKERVKQAGGSVTGDFRASLSWHNHDDLDLHLEEPNTKGGWDGHIYYGNKMSRAGGHLDVDMNAGHGTTRTPVENITYPNARAMRQGTYKLYVNQFASRESTNTGFELELEFLGTVHTFTYAPVMRTGQNVVVAEFTFDGTTLKLVKSLAPTTASRTVWGLATQTFHPVRVVMLSPNRWDGQAQGNRHYFFMLQGCQQEGKTRGFYNEFLSEALTPHRKVLELVGSKVRTEESEHQLSGLGFSSTQRNSLLVKVTGAFSRIINVTF